MLTIYLLHLFVIGLLRTVESGEVQSLRGVGVFETTNFAGINGVSMAGGGVVTIAGWGLSETPKNNQVMFTTGDVSPSPITLTGTALT